MYIIRRGHIVVSVFPCRCLRSRHFLIVASSAQQIQMYPYGYQIS